LLDAGTPGDQRFRKLLNTWEEKGLALKVHGRNEKNSPWEKERTITLANPE
jgi:hypothetical protein|tara:strand:- start:284 stop:436 length:153 start_codon:yes stop_codon:yes gene_type:complete